MALAAVLALLAVLQYRWSDEVSQAASNRMQQDLQMSMLQFQQGLTSELERIYAELLPAIRSGNHLNAHSYVQHLQHWENTNSHPALISAVYVWRPDGPQLFRLDGQEQKFRATPPPEQISRLLSRLANIPPDMRLGPPHRMPDGRERPNGRRWAIDQNIPALVLRTTDDTDDEGRFLRQQHDWVIVQLDRTVLEQHILPELVAQYFGNQRALNYQIAIRAPGEAYDVLYTSDAGFGKINVASADAAMPLWAPLPPVPLPFEHQRTPGLLGPYAPRWSRPGQQPRGQGGGFGFPPRWEVIRYTPDERDWELVARYRSGSLEAAVAQLRRKNLVISFGILSVLAAAAGLIVITTQRARRLAEMQMNFVAGVSHELRTPVAVISSAAENIVDGVVKNEQQLGRYALAIRNQAKQLTGLIEDVLLFASTQGAKREQLCDYYEVGQLVRSALQNTANFIANANCQVETHIENDLPAVRVNGSAVTHCLQNLITNAVKYGGQAQWIGISASLTSNREIAIAVFDRGPGISEKDLPHLFEPFYRGEAALNEAIHGTGIGLAVARRLAEQVGGRLTVETCLGAGTSFTLQIPSAEPTKEPRLAQRIIQPAGPNA